VTKQNVYETWSNLSCTLSWHCFSDSLDKLFLFCKMLLFSCLLLCCAGMPAACTGSARRDSLPLHRSHRVSGRTVRGQPRQAVLRSLTNEQRVFLHHDTWSVWVDELRTSKDIRSSIQKALSTPSWWESWQTLPSTTRDGVIRHLLPILIGDPQPGESDWRLHCSDAYKLCQSDNNCRWKYWNYARSCSAGGGNAAWQNMKSSFQTYGPSMQNIFQPRFLSAKRRIARSLSKKWYARRLRAKRLRSRKFRNKKLSMRRKGRWTLLRKKWHRKPSARRTRKKRRKFKPKKIASRYLTYWMGRRWRKVFKKTLPLYDVAQCSSNCRKALISLNNTVYGALLARCDCRMRRAVEYLTTFSNSARAANSTIRNSTIPFAQVIVRDGPWDEGMCRAQQANAKACRPRLFKARSTQMGCTESRIRCEHNPRCRAAQNAFLLKCSQVISGVTCTSACRSAMLALQRASRYFGTCVCDGSEAPDCQKIRSNIYDLCQDRGDCEEENHLVFSKRSPLQVASQKGVRCRRKKRTNEALPEIGVLHNSCNHRALLLRSLNLLLIVLLTLVVPKS